MKVISNQHYMSNPLTASGDIIVGGVSGAPERLPIGSIGQVAVVDNPFFRGCLVPVESPYFERERLADVPLHREADQCGQVVQFFDNCSFAYVIVADSGLLREPVAFVLVDHGRREAVRFEAAKVRREVSPALEPGFKRSGSPVVAVPIQKLRQYLIERRGDRGRDGRPPGAFEGVVV